MSTPMIPLCERDPRAMPFVMNGTSQAVLLLHGFTGTPAEMRPLGERISETFGWQVDAPLLPGHGTTIEDFSRHTYADWIGASDAEFQKLKNAFERVHLVGLSMGALLCLELARMHELATSSLVLLAPPIILIDPLERFVVSLFRIPFLSRLIPTLPRDPPLHPDQLTYNRHSTKALAEFGKARRRTLAMPTIRSIPSFLAFSAADQTVDPRSIAFLSRRLVHPLHRVVRLERSIHILTLGADRDQLFTEIEAFHRQISPPKLLQQT
ncbi:MAG TPA: alpha/beta fold hydrolase [Bdellovibrionota bacterium]|nr:alpha/beta fold hydrolase [Bdellovibrionota bacterium]